MEKTAEKTAKPEKGKNKLKFSHLIPKIFAKIASEKPKKVFFTIFNDFEWDFDISYENIENSKLLETNLKEGDILCIFKINEDFDKIDSVFVENFIKKMEKIINF